MKGKKRSYPTVRYNVLGNSFDYNFLGFGTSKEAYHELIQSEFFILEQNTIRPKEFVSIQSQTHVNDIYHTHFSLVSLDKFLQK